MARAAIRFDLSVVPKNIRITKAILSLYNHNNFFDSLGVPSDFIVKSTSSTYLVNTAWQAANTNWEKPWKTAGGDFDLNTPILTWNNTLKALRDWRSIDVTDKISAMHKGTIENYGFIIVPSKAKETENKNVYISGDFYFSSENSNTNLRPKLQITYENTTQLKPLPGKVNSFYNFTILQRNHQVSFRFNKNYTGEIVFATMSGKIILKQKVSSIKDQTISIPTDRISKGIHCIILRFNDLNQNKTIQHIQKILLN